MNTLIALGTGAAFVYSAVVTLFAGWFAAHGVEPYVYFEPVVWIIALVLLEISSRLAPRVGRPERSGV